MLSFEGALDETVTSTPIDDGHVQVDALRVDHTEPITQQDVPLDAAARMLELAAKTADQLIAGAQTEAESLVKTAQAEADAITRASRNEAQLVEAELSRSRHEQADKLDGERATALAGLAEEKSAFEEQIATLRQLRNDHRSEMRSHLTQQLALLDATMVEQPTAGTERNPLRNPES